MPMQSPTCAATKPGGPASPQCLFPLPSQHPLCSAPAVTFIWPTLRTLLLLLPLCLSFLVCKIGQITLFPHIVVRVLQRGTAPSEVMEEEDWEEENTPSFVLMYDCPVSRATPQTYPYRPLLPGACPLYLPSYLIHGTNSP